MSLSDTFNSWLSKTSTKNLSSQSLKSYVETPYKLQEFTESFGFIVYFLVICLLLSIFAGEKVTRYFLYLILASMIITNTDKFTSFLGRFK